MERKRRKRTKKADKEKGIPKRKKMVQTTLGFTPKAAKPKKKEEESTQAGKNSKEKANRSTSPSPSNGSETNERYTRIPREFFATDVVTLSKKLLGKVIRRNTSEGQIIRSRIVETEAYKAPHDKGCHAYQNKRNKKTEAFWCKPGSWYVYTIYMPTNKCLNVVAAEEGVPEAVLIRAAEPLEGIHLMQENTGKVGKNKPREIRGLTNGPGKLGRAMDIGLEYTCYDFCEEGNNDAYIEDDAEFELEDDDVVETFRVNISYAEDWRFKLWRFFIKGNKCVSVKPQTKEQIIEQGLKKGRGKKKKVVKKKATKKKTKKTDDE